MATLFKAVDDACYQASEGDVPCLREQLEEWQSELRSSNLPESVKQQIQDRLDLIDSRLRRANC